MLWLFMLATMLSSSSVVLDKSPWLVVSKAVVSMQSDAAVLPVSLMYFPTTQLMQLLEAGPAEVEVTEYLPVAQSPEH